MEESELYLLPRKRARLQSVDFSRKSCFLNSNAVRMRAVARTVSAHCSKFDSTATPSASDASRRSSTPWFTCQLSPTQISLAAYAMLMRALSKRRITSRLPQPRSGEA